MKLFTTTIALIAHSVVLRTETGENIIALDEDHHRETEGATKKVLASVEALGAISEISHEDIAPCVEHNVDYKGNDIAEVYNVQKVGDCREKCIANGNCEYFTFNQKTEVCYLKDAATGWTHIEDDGLVSGTKHCSRCNVLNVHYTGKSLLDEKTDTVDDCRTSCHTQQKCSYFSYFLASQTCYLMDTNTHNYRDVGGVISGHRRCDETCSKGGEDGTGYTCGKHASRNDINNDAECTDYENCFDTCCKCEKGYEHKGGKECVDINECTNGQPCSDNKKCENTDGSHNCVAIEKEVEPKTSKTHQTNQTTDEVTDEPEEEEKVEGKKEAKEKAEAKKEEEEGSYLPYIIGGSVAGVLLLGCGGYFFMRSQADTE